MGRCRILMWLQWWYSWSYQGSMSRLGKWSPWELLTSLYEQVQNFNGSIHFAVHALVLAQFAFYFQKASDENKNRHIQVLKRHAYNLAGMHSLYIGLYGPVCPCILELNAIDWSQFQSILTSLCTYIECWSIDSECWLIPVNRYESQSMILDICQFAA